MATTSPSQPSSEDAERIVGERLESELIDAGLDPPAARAIDHALRFLVLQLLVVFATKAEVRQIVNDSADGLRREFGPQFAALHQRVEQLERQMRWQFYILFALMLMTFATVLGSLFV